MTDAFYRKPLRADSGQPIPVPGSKSQTLRALVAAGLAAGDSRIHRALACDDSDALGECLVRLGAEVRKGPVWEVTGCGGRITPGPVRLGAGESGAALRFLLPIVAAGSGSYTVAVAGRLGERPTGDLVAALEALGGRVTREGGQGYHVTAGPGVGGHLTVRSMASSQTLSGLLLAAPLYAAGLAIEVEGSMPSPGYVDLTVGMMAHFGVPVDTAGGRFAVAPRSAYRPAEVTIEGDWSSAGYLLAAAALLGREVTLSGLDPGSAQPDRAVVSILEQAGAEVDRSGGFVALRRAPLRPIAAAFAACPDLAPTVAALVTALPGTSRLTGLSRLRDKESDRLAGLVAGLTAVGIAVDSSEEGVLAIRGGLLRPAEVDARNDHRLAMSFALLALREPGIRVKGADAVGKSYPEFYRDLARL